jgi:hypothetical protein
MNDPSQLFCKALEQWCLEGGSLRQALEKFRGHTVATKAEVAAICRALDALHSNEALHTTTDGRPLEIIAQLFSTPKTREAEQAIIDDGLQWLRWYATDALSGKPHDTHDLLSLLSVLAKYRQKEDVSVIYKAITFRIAADDPAWLTIFDAFRDQHPYIKPFLQSLAKHLPSGRCCLAFLKLCDHIATTKQLQPHAFNAPVGMEKLKSYLHPQSQRSMEFARAAICTAPLLEESHCQTILRLGDAHPDPSIPFLAKVMRATLGDQGEIDALVARCLDVNRSYETQLVLKEIGLESRIPSASQREDFLALAKTAHWLVSESPLRCSPDRLHFLESRELFWLPRHQHVRLYAVKYEFDQPQGELAIRDGIALVGSITHSLIGETNASMDLIDVYGLHCCWELEAMNDPLAPRNRTLKTGRNLLRKHNPHL